MPNLISRGMEFLARSLGQAAGVEVTYARSAASVTLTAWVGRTVFARTQSEPGPSVIFGERDYLIPVADLVLAGSPAVPARGDRVTETIDGQAVTFEVAPVEGEPAWRYSDPARTLYRVHCKRVG